MSPLIAAIRANDTEAVLVALQAGADANEIDDEDLIIHVPGSTPVHKQRAEPALMCAISMEFPYAERRDKRRYNEVNFADYLDFVYSPENIDILAALLDHGADINAQNPKGEFALFHAAFQGKLDTVSFLLRHGADTKMTNRAGNTALIIACNRNPNSEAIIEQLLAFGADVNHQNRAGITPLMCAVFSHMNKAVRLLLTNGADIELKDKDGKSAWDRIGTPTMKAILNAAKEGKSVLPSRKPTGVSRRQRKKRRRA